MTLNYEGLMKFRLENTAHYSDVDTRLYAFGVGFGRDPFNENELHYVYEKQLVAVPTMASIFVNTFSPGLLADNGVNMQLILHGEERLTLYRSLPAQGAVTYQLRVVEVFDKGKDKGALILTETEARGQDGERLFTLQRSSFARGNGGFGGKKDGVPEPQPIPARAPDLSCTLETRPDQALVYRLSGDRNPLHAEPAIARAAGFAKPILHGLCTYGTVCRAVLRAYCGYDATRIKSFDVRFSAPVYPGETLVTDIWDESGFLAFRTKVKERDVVVLNNGRCDLA
jgi:acyl dehydratase